MFLHAATNLDPVYSILIVNRRSDGRGNGSQWDLPFRVTVEAQWKTTLGGGHLHRDEYFVPQSSKHPGVLDLSSVLLPEDQGADHIYLSTGRYPPTALSVVVFDQARGTGSARSFPTDPGASNYYNLWDYGFGDKARSLRLRWELGTRSTGQGSGNQIPGVPIPPPPPPAVQSLVPDVKGFWVNPLGMRYEIGTNGKYFAWKFPRVQETGSKVRGTLRDPQGGTASIEGDVQGQTVTVKWFAHAFAHGTGTWQIAADGKTLTGLFVDEVSKGQDTWVLRR